MQNHETEQATLREGHSDVTQLRTLSESVGERHRRSVGQWIKDRKINFLPVIKSYMIKSDLEAECFINTGVQSRVH